MTRAMVEGEVEAMVVRHPEEKAVVRHSEVSVVGPEVLFGVPQRRHQVTT